MADSHEATDEQKTTLLIGFDSAWTSKNSGGLIGVLRWDDGLGGQSKAAIRGHLKTGHREKP